MARTVTLPTERGAIVRMQRDFEGLIHFGVLVADYAGPEDAKNPDAEIVYFVAGNFGHSKADVIKEMLEEDESIEYEIIPAPAPLV